MGETQTIKLTQGLVTVVDAEDFERLSKWKWFAQKVRFTFYAARNIRQANGKWKTARMHRVLMQPSEDMEIDHRNGNGLDNRRANLRICTRQENQHNRKLNKNNASGHKGVYWNVQCKKWHPQIQIDGKRMHLGLYDNINEAVAVRKAKEVELFGEFVRELP